MLGVLMMCIIRYGDFWAAGLRDTFQAAKEI